MDKRPFLAGIQQELYFLPSALQALAANSDDRRSPFELLAARIEEDGLDAEHLAGLGLFGAPEEDEHGDPVVPPWGSVVQTMAVECIDQLQFLKLVDNDYRVTQAGLRCMKDDKALRRAVRQHYVIEGNDRVKRPVVGQLTKVFAAFTALGTEREDDPFSVIYRPALCLAEFMKLHFWMQALEKRSGGRPFARMLMNERRLDLQGMGVVEDDDIEWAAHCVANGAGRRLEAQYGEKAEQRIAAVTSTALMLCDAGYLGLDGFPGELQWLRPADLKVLARRQGQTS